ncbi:MAG: hypothetical protein FWG41_04840 [Methanomassiliicoccaceae archaeon]|nr:hypothetical protein [Methanomassiliicoccaceae archaeon]
MKRPYGAFLISAAITAAMLFVLSAPIVSADTIMVVYRDDMDIQVDFPNGREIERGNELVIVVSSNKYDMERSGIWFYEYDRNTGITDTLSSVKPDHYSVLEGNAVRHVFSNLTKDIDISFSDLKELETVVVPEPAAPGTGTGTSGDNKLTMMVMLTSMILAVVMLAMLTDTLRRVNSILKEQGVIS